MHSLKPVHVIASVAATAALVASSMIGLAAPAGATSLSVWDKLAQCESDGKWDANTGNGFYGGLQFADGTWDAMGGEKFAKRADLATKIEQIKIAEKVQDDQGWRAWPACSRRIGLR